MISPRYFAFFAVENEFVLIGKIRVNPFGVTGEFPFLHRFSGYSYFPFGRVAVSATLNNIWDGDTPSLPTNFVNGRSAYSKFQHHRPY